MRTSFTAKGRPSRVALKTVPKLPVAIFPSRVKPATCSPGAHSRGGQPSTPPISSCIHPTSGAEVTRPVEAGPGRDGLGGWARAGVDPVGSLRGVSLLRVLHEPADLWEVLVCPFERVEVGGVVQVERRIGEPDNPLVRRGMP